MGPNGNWTGDWMGEEREQESTTGLLGLYIKGGPTWGLLIGGGAEHVTGPVVSRHIMGCGPCIMGTTPYDTFISCMLHHAAPASPLARYHPSMSPNERTLVLGVVQPQLTGGMEVTTRPQSHLGEVP